MFSQVGWLAIMTLKNAVVVKIFFYRKFLVPKRIQSNETSFQAVHTSRGRMVETEVHFDKPEPDTFMTQKRHPVHHFINFVKFSTFGASLLYLGNQSLHVLQGRREDHPGKGNTE